MANGLAYRAIYEPVPPENSVGQYITGLTAACKYSLGRCCNTVSDLPRVPDAEPPGSVPSALSCRCHSLPRRPASSVHASGVNPQSRFLGDNRQRRQCACRLGPHRKTRTIPRLAFIRVRRVPTSYPRLQSRAGGRPRSAAVFIVGWSCREGRDRERAE
jgi:hypothetical protein